MQRAPPKQSALVLQFLIALQPHGQKPVNPLLQAAPGPAADALAGSSVWAGVRGDIAGWGARRRPQRGEAGACDPEACAL
jgi:hypothetical protein